MNILFFAPHSALWAHAFPEALVAESLAGSGHRITYVTCGRVYSGFCIPMSAERLHFDSPQPRKLETCAHCERNRDLIRAKFGFAGCDLAQRVTPGDVQRAGAMIRAVDRPALLETKIDGIEAGRIAAYEFLLNHKLSSFDFNEAQWAEYELHLEYVIVTILAIQRLLDETRPERLVVYNSAYSVTRAACRAAEQRGIPYYFLHAGGNLTNRLQTLMIGRGSTLQFLKNAVRHWDRLQARPCDPALMRLAIDHFIELIQGRSFLAYSSPKQGEGHSIRSRFGVREDQKLLVATMSSYDERIGAETIGIAPAQPDLIFAHQNDWISALLQFMTTRPDLFLIVRVHPREFPNKREAVKSQNAGVLQQLLRDLPDNVRVNWPTDGLSMYDLAEEVDVILNAWSSVGKEMSLLGLPVVLYSPDLMFYPPDLNYVGATREAYFQAIDQALADGWSAERVRRTLRWMAVEFGYALIDVANGVAGAAPTRSLIEKVWSRAGRAVDPAFQERQDCRRRTALADGELLNELIVSAQEAPLDLRTGRLPPPISQDEETAHLRRELGRLAKALFGAAPAGEPSRLNRNISAFVRGD